MFSQKPQNPTEREKKREEDFTTSSNYFYFNATSAYIPKTPNRTIKSQILILTVHFYQYKITLIERCMNHLECINSTVEIISSISSINDTSFVCLSLSLSPCFEFPVFSDWNPIFSSRNLCPKFESLAIWVASNTCKLCIQVSDLVPLLLLFFDNL